MAKINLLNHKIKLLRKLATEKKVWYVVKEQNESLYYINEVNKWTGTVKWTRSRNNAMQFHTQSGIQHFSQIHLKNRDDYRHVSMVEDM